MKQPSDLTDSVQLIPGKLITKLLITKLQTQVTELTDKKSKLSVQIDQKYQYSRGNCILKLGVEEKQNEENDTISINIIKEHLRLDNQPSNIDGTHCIGGKMNCVRKVEKYLLSLEGSIFEKKNKKRKFKESNISVTESLTSLKIIKLKDGRYKYGFNKIWISNGRIMVMKEESIKPDGYGWLKKQLFFYTLCYRKEFCWAFHLPYFGAITIRHI